MFSAQLAFSKCRKLLQVAVPAVVFADTARSIYLVHDLAARRLQEWEEEDNAALAVKTRATLRRLVGRCQAKDADFWPAAITAAAGVACGTNAAACDLAADASHDPIWQLLQDAPAPSAAAADAQPAVHDPDAAFYAVDRSLLEPAVSPSAGSRHVIIYVTWNDMWSHVVQTMHLLSNAASHSVCSSLDAQRRMLAADAVACVDAVGQRCKDALPWPQLSFQRRSSLRFAVTCRGGNAPTGGRDAQPLELQLSNL